MTVSASVVSADHPAESPSRWQFGAGDHISDELTALELLGGGDRYEAYLAWHDRLHAPVVAKLLRPTLVGDRRARAAIAGEAEALAALGHPYLVRAFGGVTDGPRPHVVMEHLDGPRLSTLVRRFGPLAVEQVVPLARQLASVLAYMRAAGWAHLDVKPRNVIMTGQPKLIDLSVARRVDAGQPVRGLVGTDAYMAPEQADARRFTSVGPAADVFGLGATLFEAVSGRQAFPATPTDRFPQLRPGRPAMPPSVPEVLADAILASLADDPATRPTPAQVYDRLEPLVDWSARAVRRLR